MIWLILIKFQDKKVLSSSQQESKKSDKAAISKTGAKKNILCSFDGIDYCIGGIININNKYIYTAYGSTFT